MNVLENIPFHPTQAVVFDIDDTLIHSRTHTPIPSINRLYKYCRARGYHIYIITARPYTLQNARFTAQELHHHGYWGYKKIFFRHPKEMRVALYKQNARKSIPETIVMSIGDQPGDMGAYGGVGILVNPNG
tara:strand:- start:57 stop:449 length:393 start_codon:yes stop_codon:yes gene_type:complete